jgi:4-amino-4-deoxy-L-arabinose transferase-like glycosyltransferase
MPTSSMPPEDPQERSQPEYENDVTLMSLVALPKDLDPHGNLGIQQRSPSFFVLASPSPTQSTSKQQSKETFQEDEHNGEVKKEIQVLVEALDILDRSKTPSLGDEVSSTASSASSGEKSGKQHVPDEVTRTSTSTLLATGLKTVEAVSIKAYIPAWLRMVIIVLGLAAILVAHAINMFSNPRYESDEGVYMMSAWAITHGRIEAYPYGYGHPPLAWIVIAVWTKLTGGFFTFGNAINSGRVLVLLMTVGSAWFVYRIAYHLRLGFMACLFAMLVFALLPLSIIFQRKVLLDNFATFWFLLALYLIIAGKSRLSYTASAGICFGFGLLSKEVLIILFPAMIYVVWLYTTRFQRTFMLACFLYAVIAVTSTFVLMAVLKGELFPYEWHLPWDHHRHLSLIGTYTTQAARGSGEGSIAGSWASWVNSDPLLVILGIGTPTFNFIFGWWNRKHLFLALLAIFFWGLLLRGGVVFPFYIIPLIPLIALNAAATIDIVGRWIGRIVRFTQIGSFLTLVALVALIPYDIQQSLNTIFSQRPALVQAETLTWIRAHVPRRAVIVINSNLFADLHEPGGEGAGDGAIYPYAHVYWNVALDPEVHDTLLQNNWDRIDYIVADWEMLQKIPSYGGGMNLIKTALEHAVLCAELKGDNEFIQIYQVIHTKPPPDI